MKNEMIITKPEQQPTTQIVLDKQQHSWWNSLTDKQRETIVSFAIVLGISVVALIAIKFAASKMRKMVAHGEENQSFGRDEHATWAKQLKMAFDNDGWWGTDEVKVRQALRSIPSKEDFRKVQISYRRLYKGRNLIEDMTDELKSSEFNEMLAIIQAKPEKAKDAKEGGIYDPHGWAKRLYNAMSYYYMGFIPGTDEDAIKAVFSEMESKRAFYDTKQAYQQLYGEDMEDELDGDLDWSMDWRAIINRKPSN